MTDKLKTIPIKGKDYVMVNDRVKAFRENYRGYALTSEIIFNDGTTCIFRAEVIDPEGKVVAVGHAQEVKGSSNINKTSHIENCETSAWGRALGNFGIGIDDSICSADELVMALQGQETETPEDIAKRKLKDKKVELQTSEDFAKTLENLPFASKEQTSKIEKLCDEIGQPIDRVLASYKVAKLIELTEAQANDCIKKLEGAKK